MLLYHNGERWKQPLRSTTSGYCASYPGPSTPKQSWQPQPEPAPNALDRNIFWYKRIQMLFLHLRNDTSWGRKLSIGNHACSLLHDWSISVDKQLGSGCSVWMRNVKASKIAGLLRVQMGPGSKAYHNNPRCGSTLAHCQDGGFC